MSTIQVITLDSDSVRYGEIEAVLDDGVPQTFTRDTAGVGIQIGALANTVKRAFLDIPITNIPFGSQIISTKLQLSVADSHVITNMHVYYGHLPKKPSEITDQALYHACRSEREDRIVNAVVVDNDVAVNFNKHGIDLLQSYVNSQSGWFGICIALPEDEHDGGPGYIEFYRSAGVRVEIEYTLPLTGSHWLFDRTLADANPLGKDFTAINGTEQFAKSVKYDVFQNQLVVQYGILFEEDTYYSAGNNFNFGNDGCAITVAFNWYSGTALGKMKHVVTKNITPRVAPIVAKAVSTITDGIEYVSECEFVITEFGYSDTENAIQVTLFDAAHNKLRRFQSEPYKPGKHTVYLVIENYAVNILTTFCCARIDIDGKPGAIVNVQSDISSTGSPLTINKTCIGHTAHKTTQSGIISDLVVGNIGGVKDPENSYKYTLFGGKYLCEEGYSLSKFSFNGISYQRNETVTTNQILSEGNNIYVARSNGEIQKGFQSVWDNEFNYITPSEVDRLTVKDANKHGSVEWSPDGLKITGATVRA